jgi:luciferase family oxidoreductase group 1
MSSNNRTAEYRVQLSVLDLVHVRSDQTSADAVAATLALAGLADRLGYARYWIAEHHEMLAVASTNPPVLIGLLAGTTQRIRVGSGGVLLPNHAPLVLAEQFALLEAAHPGRIDLGVGRTAGPGPHSPGRGDALGELLALVGATGVHDDVGLHRRGATPYAASVPPIWILGASESSARTAARLGLPYVFGHHLGVGGTAAALRAYRAGFRPSAALGAPRTLLPVRASVADTYDEAYAAALPWLLVMLGLLSGKPPTRLRTIEEARDIRLSPGEQAIVHREAAGYVIGDPTQAQAQINDLAASFAVDEVMIHPVASAHDGDDPRTASGAEQTLSLLAGAWVPA